MTKSSRILASAAAIVLSGTVAIAGRTPTAHAGVSAVANPVIRTATDSTDVAATVHAFHAALQAGDSAAAMNLLAPDVVIQESGAVESRSVYAGHHLPGDMRFAQALPGVRSAQRVVVAGDVAWSTSASTTKGTYRDRQVNSAGAELMILSRSNGVWRIRAIHWSSRALKS